MDGGTDMTRLIFGFRNFAKATKITRSAHTAYLCVLCGSENKQRLFPYTTLTDWFVSETETVYFAVRTGSLHYLDQRFSNCGPRVLTLWSF